MNSINQTSVMILKNLGLVSTSAQSNSKITMRFAQLEKIKSDNQSESNKPTVTGKFTCRVDQNLRHWRWEGEPERRERRKERSNDIAPWKSLERECSEIPREWNPSGVAIDWSPSIWSWPKKRAEMRWQRERLWWVGVSVDQNLLEAGF